MSDNQGIQFNKQLFETPQNPQPVPEVIPASNDNRSRLIALIKSAQKEPLFQFLNSLPTPENLINSRDESLKQNVIYESVQIKDQSVSVEITKLLIEKGGHIKIKDVHGQSPLFYICRDGNLPLLELFLSQSVDINESDSFKQSPLFYASRENRIDFIREMLSHGANPNHRDKVNETALFYAAREGNKDVCRVLLEGGADVNILDNKRQTALFFAKKSKNNDLADFLISKGAINTKDGKITKNDLLRQKEIGNIDNLADKLLSIQNANKKYKKKKKNTKDEKAKNLYRLCLANEDLSVEEYSKEKFAQFKEEYPKIADLLLNPDKLQNTDMEDQKKFLETDWQSFAQEILTTVKKSKGAKIFNTPVDYVKLNIPDYPEIVKNPMDFGTIKVG